MNYDYEDDDPNYRAGYEPLRPSVAWIKLGLFVLALAALGLIAEVVASGVR